MGRTDDEADRVKRSERDEAFRLGWDAAQLAAFAEGVVVTAEAEVTHG